MCKKMKYIIILVLMLIVASSKIKAEELAAGSYKIGDKITYNGMDFYVIADSDENSDRVTMLKADPLTVEEVNTYGVGHVNRYTVKSVGTAYNYNGYGGMAYYTSETCGYTTAGDWGSEVSTGCTTDYVQSEVKYVIDAWTIDKLKTADLKEDTSGYKVRLLTHYELVNNLGYESIKYTTAPSTNGTTPDWVYDSKYWYWTMSPHDNSSDSVWSISSNGGLGYGVVDSSGGLYDYRDNGDGTISPIGGDGFGKGTVRPVITLSKKLEPIVDSDNEEITSTEKVAVPNTFLNKTTLLLTVGIIAIIISVIIIYIVTKGRSQRK